MFWNSFNDRVVAPVLMIGVAPLLLLSLAIPYAILKLRDARLEGNDPQVGLKAALNFGFSLGLLLALLGLTVLVDVNLDDFASPSSSSSSTVSGSFTKSKGSMSSLSNLSPGARFGLGLLVAGASAAGIQFIFILAMTNQRRYADARRLFVGWRLAVHSVVLLVAYTILVVELFTSDAVFSFKLVQEPVSFLIVWLPSWVVHLVMLRMYQRASPPRVRLEIPERSYGDD